MMADRDKTKIKLLISSPYEREVHYLLSSGLDGATIYPKIRVADVVDLDPGGMSAQERRIYMAGHFDFAIAHGIAVQFVVEVDSRYHHDCDQTKRDEAKDALCRRARLPILRFDLSTDIEPKEIRNSAREMWVCTAHPDAEMFVDAFKDELRRQYSPLDLKRDVVKEIVSHCSSLETVMRLGERYAMRFKRDGPMMGTQHIGFAMAVNELEKVALRVASEGPKDAGPASFVNLMIAASRVPGDMEYVDHLLKAAEAIKNSSEDRLMETMAECIKDLEATGGAA